jgi:hypothetical protein
MSVDAMGSIANQLRSMLNNNGFSETKVIGYEHNWVSSYPSVHALSPANRFLG